MKRSLLLLSLIVSCCVSAAAYGQNLITNGSFEAAPHAPSSDMTGWMVGGTGHIHSIAEGATDGTYSAAFSVGHDSQGTTLSQTFATTNGSFYLLTFDAGVYGQRTGGPLQLRVQVIDSNSNSVIVDQVVTPSYAGTSTASAVTFNHYQYGFTAGGGSMTVRFTDIGLGNASADTVLDTVSVVQSTPPGPNQAVNGSFENGIHGQSGFVEGWNVVGNVASYTEGATTGSYGAIFSAGGDSQGDMLSQSFATTPGTSYKVDFDAGIFGQRSDGPLQLRVQIFGGTPLVDEVITPPDAFTFDASAVSFAHYTYTVTATGSSVTLQFTNMGAGTSVADQVVDTVVFASAPATPTPTPSSPTPTPSPSTPTPTPSHGYPNADPNADTGYTYPNANSGNANPNARQPDANSYRDTDHAAAD
jgi:hypothetical protein